MTSLPLMFPQWMLRASGWHAEGALPWSPVQGQQCAQSDLLRNSILSLASIAINNGIERGSNAGACSVFAGLVAPYLHMFAEPSCLIAGFYFKARIDVVQADQERCVILWLCPLLTLQRQMWLDVVNPATQACEAPSNAPKRC